MKKFLTAFVGLFVLSLASPRVFAIDALLHDVVDHTIGHGHHHQYYSYDPYYTGYTQYPGYYGYRRPYYRNTYRVWTGGHHHHHTRALGHFGLTRHHRHGH